VMKMPLRCHQLEAASFFWEGLLGEGRERARRRSSTLCRRANDTVLVGAPDMYPSL